MKKVLSELKPVNFLLALVYAVVLGAAVLLLAHVVSSNDVKSFSNTSTNVAVYPSVAKAAALAAAASPVWAIFGVILLLAAGVFAEVLRVGTEVSATTGSIILGLAVPVAAAFATYFIPAYRVQEFTHHTISAQEYQAAKDSKLKLDSYFTKANQEDALYLSSSNGE